MLRKRHSIRVALTSAFIALFMLLTAQAVTAPASRTVSAAPASGSAAAITPATVQPLAVKAKKRKLTKAQLTKRKAVRRAAYLRTCRKSRKFREGQAGFPQHVVDAGRCITSRVKGLKTIGTRGGHHPSASRALDIMVNTHGSCRAGRKAGNKIARYFMENKRLHKVYYVIWRNGYWNARDKQRPISNFRKMGRGGCTAGHYDHVHVAFK